MKNLEDAEQSILEHESDGTDTQQMADRANFIISAGYAPV